MIYEEVYLIEKLKELGISEKGIKEILSYFAGCMVSFRKTKIEKLLICEEAKKLKEMDFKFSKIIEILAKRFDKSESAIRKKLKGCDGL